MKYSFRFVTIILAFVIAIAAFSVWLLFRRYDSKQSLETQQRMNIFVPPIKGEVDFYFLECVGKRSVFVLENQTDHLIFARVHRADQWKEFKDANLEYGLHLIEYKASNAESFEDVSNRWDAVELFKEILPGSKVRYGIDLGQIEGEYIVKIPYMEDTEVAEQLNRNWSSIIKNDFERVKNAWKEVRTISITNQCH